MTPIHVDSGIGGRLRRTCGQCARGVLLDPALVGQRELGLPNIDVAIVEDDESVRESTGHLLRLLGYATATFASAEDFLNSGLVHDTACLITDVRLPGISGVELQSRLILDGHRIPIIFVSAFPNAAVRGRVLKSGAISYLSKPLPEQSLIDSLNRALKRST